MHLAHREREVGIEAQRIRSNASGMPTGSDSGLPAGYRFIMGGDTNLQSSNDAPYQALVGAAPSPTGRFFDPIATPGSWNNNGASASRKCHSTW